MRRRKVPVPSFSITKRGDSANFCEEEEGGTTLPLPSTNYGSWGCRRAKGAPAEFTILDQVRDPHSKRTNNLYWTFLHEEELAK